jgi:hypothetical protein
MPDEPPPAVAPAEKTSTRPDRPPEAVLIHASSSKWGDIQRHSMALDAIARKIMGLENAPRPGLWSSTQDQVWKFFRAKPSEELLFPDGHPLAKQPRYRWYEETPLILVGYLKPEAVQQTREAEAPSAGRPAVPGSVRIES